VLPVKKLGTIYSQSEPQSVMALDRIRARCLETGMELVALPVNNSNETQLVVAAVLNKNVDAFFALPDNAVFASMEVIARTCDNAHVPVFTSEEGLVRRGAVAGFGADMYQWGYQCGLQAAAWLSGERNLVPEAVKVRRKVFNPAKATAFGLTFDSGFAPVDSGSGGP
jgi:putative ABC transport system substrate-binding protein